MTETITTEPAGKRARNGSVILTDRMCEKRVTKRIKIYDRKCPGLYVSIHHPGSRPSRSSLLTAAPASSEIFGSACSVPSVHVEDARGTGLRPQERHGRGENIADSFRRQKATEANRGTTVDEIIEERIEWMKMPVKKPDGEMRPRIESWENVASHLRRFVSPRLGKKIASEVTKHDIATLSNDIVAGKLGVPSVANARHMRRAASGLFNWAAEAGRDYVSASPASTCRSWTMSIRATRVLSEDEIRTLWHGLDRDDLPWDRRTRLALKFALVTMLRSGELLPIHRDELNAGNGTVDIPARRVKKRRVINQPLVRSGDGDRQRGDGQLRVCLRRAASTMRRCRARR